MGSNIVWPEADFPRFVAGFLQFIRQFGCLLCRLVHGLMLASQGWRQNHNFQLVLFGQFEAINADINLLATANNLKYLFF